MGDFFSHIDAMTRALSVPSGAPSIEHATARLSSLARELAGALDTAALLNAVGDAVLKATHGSRFVVLLTEAAELRAVASRDAGGRELALPAMICRDLCQKTVDTRQVLFVDLRHPDAPYKADPDAIALGLTGVLAIPMISPRAVKGVIYVDYQGDEGPAALDGHVLDVLLLLAGHAAAALESTDLPEPGAPASVLETHDESYFLYRLHEEYVRSVRYSRGFSIVLLEIEDGDAYLAKYGIQSFDALCKAVAAELRLQARQADIVARYGPASFAALLLETPAENELVPRLFVERLRQALMHGGLFIDGVPVQLAVRAGGITYPNAPVIGPQGLLHELAVTLEVAKKSGMDHFVVR